MAQIHAQHFVDVVVQLLQRPFGSRSVADQKLTVQQPRPLPDLKIKTGDRSFQMEWYAKKDWLCGSVVRNGLFCFYIFLFWLGRRAIIHSTRYCYCTNAHSCKLLCISLLPWQACNNSLNSILLLYKCSFL